MHSGVPGLSLRPSHPGPWAGHAHTFYETFFHGWAALLLQNFEGILQRQKRKSNFIDPGST